MVAIGILEQLPNAVHPHAESTFCNTEDTSGIGDRDVVEIEQHRGTIQLRQTLQKFTQNSPFFVTIVSVTRYVRKIALGSSKRFRLCPRGRPTP